MREREEVVTVVDNERCDGGSETSTAMSSIWYHIHTAILPFLYNSRLSPLFPRATPPAFDSPRLSHLYIEQDFEKSSDARTRGNRFHALASSEGESQVIHHTNHNG